MIALAAFWSDWYYILGAIVAGIAVLGGLWGGLKVFLWARDVSKVLVGSKGGDGTRAEKPLVDIVDEHTVALTEINRQLKGSNGKTAMETIEAVREEQLLVARELRTSQEQALSALSEHEEKEAHARHAHNETLAQHITADFLVQQKLANDLAEIAKLLARGDGK